MRRLLRVSRIPEDGTFPFAKATMFKWHHLGKFPELFVKISGALFIDLDELDRIVEAGKGK